MQSKNKIKIYICSELIKRKLLKIFRIKHLSILTSDGNKYEVDIDKKAKIFIRHTKVNVEKVLKKVNYKIISLNENKFIKNLKRAKINFVNKRYWLLWRNCYTFVKRVIDFKKYGIQISIIGNFV